MEEEGDAIPEWETPHQTPPKRNPQICRVQLTTTQPSHLSVKQPDGSRLCLNLGEPMSKLENINLNTQIADKGKGSSIKPIFSGEYSRDMWREINGAESIEDLKSALYTVCCRLQELEAKIAKDIPNIELESFGTTIVPNSHVIVNGKRIR